jgi:hypothetical protein
MSMYGPLLAMARYSPSWEKLRALIAFLGGDELVISVVPLVGTDVLAGGDGAGAYPLGELKHVDDRVVTPGSKISG